jgi:protein O-mannosyl-transferase
MSGKKNKIKQPNRQPTQANGTPAGSGNIFSRYPDFFIPAAIALLTWLFLSVCNDGLLTNWDDPGYVRDNPLIKDLSADGIKAIFSTPTMGNYHPLTILSYAIEYSFVQLQPYLYHMDSLLLHILVTLLVYFFTNMLTRRRAAAAVTALLFGLHPMHIESVAWIAGRKDVLYAAFYMGACIAYIRYVRSTGKKMLWYALLVLLFICSLLSKPVAVVLPVTLLLIDILEGAKPGVRLLVNKILLFAISVGFGVESIFDQQKFKALDTLNVSFNFFERFALGCYALCTYLWKALIPVHLCNFYPYPGKPLAATFYLYPIIVAGLAFVIWRYWRKNKVAVFGTLFFLVNIILLLQFIPVGGAILADRYSYIAYLGLFFIVGWLVSYFFEPGADKNKRNIVLAGVAVYVLALGYMSNQRCRVWYDAVSLWRDEVEKEPDRATNAYNNLGFEYFNKYNTSINPEERKIYYDSANMLLTKAIAMQPDYANPYISLGELERVNNQFPLAKANYYKALSLKYSDEDASAYLGLAIIYAISNYFDSSGYCFKRALELQPYFPEAQSNYGNFWAMTGHPDSALVHYAIAICQNPDMYAPHLNRAKLYQRTNRCDQAMPDLERCIDLAPDLGEPYFVKAQCEALKGNRDAATRDVAKARELGFH